MIQELNELNEFHKNKDPWGYKNNPDDKKRLEILLSEIPNKEYKNVLDIGCGQGFITSNLPGENIIGVDISEAAITNANSNNTKAHITFKNGSIFEINKLISKKFDLIIITGVLYPQYIGKASSLIYKIIDELLEHNGIFISVHINEWYTCQFPFLKLKEHYYSYRNYNHKLEIYGK
jgi:2-polyprenyl-3-methyl-5-hydroxy-6-metoxy-1,4-benzoquinol methylase